MSAPVPVLSTTPDAALAQVQDWFSRRGWQVFDFQAEAWAAFRAGESGLIHSPTGSGKSLAAFLGPVLEWLADPAPERQLRVLWVTPLRALANDLAQNLRTALEGLNVPWEVGVRTGDTSSSVRARQNRRLPEVLITTPESLSLLLSYADTLPQLGLARAVVVDEWHELLGNKRGVLLELALARVRRLAPQLRLWGLSATLGNLDEALQVLLGPGQSGHLVGGHVHKEIRIDSLIPERIETFPWAGHLGLKLLQPVIRHIEQARTTLLFTNTRAQAELWYEALVRARSDWLTEIGLHHGSLDRELRSRIELALKTGSLRCVVCTSSLDLGVDFTPVDLVIQVGSPKGVARLLQRAGRSGHAPGEVSRVLCVPSHAFELVEIAAARRAQTQGQLEARIPLRRTLDVLCQHVVTLSLQGIPEPAALFEEVRSSYAFQDLTQEEWHWVLEFVTQGGAALHAYPEYHKVEATAAGLKVTNRTIAQRHRMAIGIITSDAAMQVKFVSGGSLGTVEESFVTRLKPGDAFLYSGRLLELVRIKDMMAYVRLTRSANRIVPRWSGSQMPLSTHLAKQVVELLAHPELDGPELQAVAHLLARQQRLSALPDPDHFLIELHRSREGFHLFWYPFGGRLVHEGLAALIAYRLAQRQPNTFKLTVNDYGMELLASQPVDLTEADVLELLSDDNLLEDLVDSINYTEHAKRHFREIARIAGLIFQGFPGSGKSTRQLQFSSGILYDVLRQYDSDNQLLHQAQREVLEQHMELPRLQDLLNDLRRRQPRLRSVRSFTPLAFPLWAERLRSQIISTEDWETRIRRMLERLEKKR